MKDKEERKTKKIKSNEINTLDFFRNKKKGQKIVIKNTKRKDVEDEQKPVIKNMEKKDLELALSWAKKQGWNPGKKDYKHYYRYPKGLFMLFQGKKPIGSIAAVKYEEDGFGFIGLFIVIKKYQRQGYGTQLWNKAMEYLSTCETIGLNSVPQLINFYGKSSFIEYTVNKRWVSATRSTTSYFFPKKHIKKVTKCKHNPTTHKLCDNNENITNFLTKKKSRKLKEPTLFDRLSSYDKKNWKDNREKLLASLVKTHGVYIFINDEKVVFGFGVIRPLGEGYRASIYANDPKAAKKLAKALFASIPKEEKVTFDIPAQNKFAQVFVGFFNLEQHEEANTNRMYKDENEFNKNKEKNCYGLVSLELG